MKGRGKNPVFFLANLLLFKVYGGFMKKQLKEALKKVEAKAQEMKGKMNKAKENIKEQVENIKKPKK